MMRRSIVLCSDRRKSRSFSRITQTKKGIFNLYFFDIEPKSSQQDWNNSVYDSGAHPKNKQGKIVR